MEIMILFVYHSLHMHLQKFAHPFITLHSIVEFINQTTALWEVDASFHKNIGLQAVLDQKPK